MDKEVKKLTKAEIEKRVHEVADENGQVSMESIIKLAKEFYGEDNPEMDAVLPEYLAYAKEIDSRAQKSENEMTIPDELPF